MNQITTQAKTISPAQLWLGNHDDLMAKTTAFLQKTFCLHHGCATCTICRALQQQQHHAVIWLNPEKRYTLDLLEPIFKTISFALGNKQHHFFILQNADFLTPVCANSLLKSIEEPPEGYHFILLAEREEHILPTIRSRRIVHTFHGNKPQTNFATLGSFFTTTKQTTNPLAFLQELQACNINDRESVELLDYLLSHWLASYKKTLLTKNKTEHARTCSIITILKKAQLTVPMPGSSKIFWRNLFLHVQQAIA